MTHNFFKSERMQNGTCINLILLAVISITVFFQIMEIRIKSQPPMQYKSIYVRFGFHQVNQLIVQVRSNNVNFEMY